MSTHSPSPNNYQRRLRRDKIAAWSCLLLFILALALPFSGWSIALAIVVYTLLLFFRAGEYVALLRRMALLWGSILLSLAPLLLVFSSEGLLIDLGGWGIGQQELRQALSVGLRCITTVGILALLLELLPFSRLYELLRRSGLPELFVELMELSYRYIFLLDETRLQIATAQRARLGYEGWRAQLRHSGMLIARTFVLTQEASDKLFDGLQSRGYEEQLPEALPAAQPQEPLLRMEGIGFRYNKMREALHALDLSIYKGERIALLGKNGAGKSTFFALASGLHSPSTGTIYLHGQALEQKQRKQLRRAVALVMQNANHQLFTPSVEEEIAFGLRNLQLPEELVQQRLEEIIREFALEELRHQPPHKLSEGQKKWVSLAAVLATDPEILLLDEPTAALDKVYTKRVLELLDKLHQQGKTLILSTHDMELAYQYSDRILLLSGGRKIADGAAATIWQDKALLQQAGLEQPLLLELQARRRSQRQAASLQPSNDYHLPLFLSVSKLPLLFVGGGEGVYRKVMGLVERGILATILAPSFLPALEQLAQEGKVKLIRSSLSGQTDTSAFFAVVLGIGDAAEEERLAQLLSARGHLVSSLSDSQLGHFHFAATGQKEGLCFALHSDFTLPRVTAALRDRWQELLPEGLYEELQQLAALRAASKDTQDKTTYLAREEQVIKRIKA